MILPEVAVHIVQRGHDRRDCFREDTDYLVYLANLLELSGDAGCAVHAYCLMTNHVHLLLTPSQPQSCALLMRNLGQRYVQYFNKRYRRTGTLWEGRFRSCLVESARYVIACHRYVEMNPMRAGMVTSPSAYRWSSHGGNAGHCANRLLSAHPEYIALGTDETVRHSAYKALFLQSEEPAFLHAIRDATNGGLALIGESLRASVPEDLRRRIEHKAAGRRGSDILGSSLGVAELEFELGLRPRNQSGSVPE